MSNILRISDPAALDISRSGGKGAGLARAAQHMPVPVAIVLVSDVYRAFVHPVQESLTTILNNPQLDHMQRSATIRTLLQQQPLPPGLLEELADAMQTSGLDHVPVAVRSSGTMEDLPGVSFAGQHDTILGMVGVTQVADAIHQCYLSLWNAHVLPYRERMGLNHQDAAMAVVVQKLVQVNAEEAAGVAFSIDPVRGSLDHVLINAGFGLGETVVSGDAPVDEYRLQRQNLIDVETHIAEKPAALITDAQNGTRLDALPLTQQQQPALNVAQRRAVATLALAAEAHFGFPQDIEWAFQEGQLYLLQSRPITHIPAQWTRDESAERFPNPVTPLTWDLCEEGFHSSLNYSFKLMGLPPFGDKWFAMRDYYIYGNQNAVRLYSGRTPTAMLKDIDSIRAALPQIAEQYAWAQELPVRWMRDLDTYLLEIGALMREPLEKMYLSELWDYVLRINTLGKRYFLPNIAISLTQRTLYVGLRQLLTLALPPEEVQQVFDCLLAATDTKTGQVNAELWELSRQIRANSALLQAMRDQTSLRLLAALPHYSNFHDAFQTFLQRHGHRELDFDAYHPTWIEAPECVLDQLKILCELPNQDRAKAEQDQKMQQAEIEHAVLSRTPEELRYLVHEVIRLARVYTALDDLEHYQTTRLTLPFRRGLREVGQRLVCIGILQEPMDIYFCPFRELDQAIRNNRFDALPTLIATHKGGYLAAKERSPDWMHGEKEMIQVGGDGVLTGLGGSPGTFEGEVFLVHGPEDFSHFPADAILVARTTNPAWTPLFYQARGVITESGGPLSHGAVVARELKLPAVMGVRHALRLLKNGQRVRIDGRLGTVQCL